jgi:hypothetical protein
MTSNVCRQCGADVSVVRINHVEGEEGGIRVAIDGLPVLNCASGHKRFTTPDFPLEFVQRLAESGALDDVTPAVQKGLFRKRLLCPSCGQEVAAETNGDLDGKAQVEVPDGDPVHVKVKVPLFRCSGCNQEVTEPKSGLERDLMQAVANAFRSAEIPPG